VYEAIALHMSGGTITIMNTEAFNLLWPGDRKFVYISDDSIVIPRATPLDNSKTGVKMGVLSKSSKDVDIMMLVLFYFFCVFVLPLGCLVV
jgi:hypothetical protein